MQFIKNKVVISFLAAVIVSCLVYFIVRHGQLFPIPFYVKPCALSGGAGGSLCGGSDNTSLVALYVNIIFVWFVFFFFYICLSLLEIFIDASRAQVNK
jgi:hypothetical protein